MSLAYGRRADLLATAGSSPSPCAHIPRPARGGYDPTPLYGSSPTSDYSSIGYGHLGKKISAARWDSDSQTLNARAATPEERYYGLVAQLAALIFDSVWRTYGEGGINAQPPTSKALRPFLHSLLLATQPTPLAGVLAALFYVEKLRKAHPTARGKEGFEQSVLTCALVLSAKFWSEDTGFEGLKSDEAEFNVLEDEGSFDDEDDCNCKFCIARAPSPLDGISPKAFFAGEDTWRASDFRGSTGFRRYASPEPERRSVWELAANAEDPDDGSWQPGRRSNLYWARHAGIALQDLTTMESEFLAGLGFRLNIDRFEFLEWLDRVEDMLRSYMRGTSGAVRLGRKLLGLVRGVREKCLVEMRKESSMTTFLPRKSGPRRPGDEPMERSVTPESVSSDATVCE